MNVHPARNSQNRPLAIIGDPIYAPINFERTFDSVGSENSNDGQKHAGSTPHLMTVQSRRGAESPASREDVFAVKTAQLVADHLAHESRAALARLGTEFALASFVRDTARSVANLTIPTLHPLGVARRLEVADRAVNPDDCGEVLDLILDGVGRVLSAYCALLPSPDWVPLPSGNDGTSDARVVGWRGPDKSVVLDLLDTSGPQHPGSDHEVEVRDVLAVGQRRFGATFAVVRYFPTYAMSQARVYYPDGDWVPYLAHPRPTISEAA